MAQADAGGPGRILRRRRWFAAARASSERRGGPAAGGVRQARRHLSADQDAGAAVRVHLRRPRPRRARRQRAGAGVPGIATARPRTPRRKVGFAMAVRADRRAARQGRHGGEPGRGPARAIGPAAGRERRRRSVAATVGDRHADRQRARATEAGASAKAAALRDMVRSGRLDDVASVANDESLRRYAESRVTLKAQIAELGRTMLPGHPRMKELSRPARRARAGDPRRGDEARARLRGRRAHRRRAGQEPATGGGDAGQDRDFERRRPGQAARARDRRQDRARATRILSHQISRGDLPQRRQRRARQRPHHRLSR